MSSRNIVKNLQQPFERWGVRAPIRYRRACTAQWTTRVLSVLAYSVLLTHFYWPKERFFAVRTASRKNVNYKGRLFEIARLFCFFPKCSRFYRVAHLSGWQWEATIIVTIVKSVGKATSFFTSFLLSFFLPPLAQCSIFFPIISQNWMGRGQVVFSERENPLI